MRLEPFRDLEDELEPDDEDEDDELAEEAEELRLGTARKMTF